MAIGGTLMFSVLCLLAHAQMNAGFPLAWYVGIFSLRLCKKMEVYVKCRCVGGITVHKKKNGIAQFLFWVTNYRLLFGCISFSSFL